MRRTSPSLFLLLAAATSLFACSSSSTGSGDPPADTATGSDSPSSEVADAGRCGVGPGCGDGEKCLSGECHATFASCAEAACGADQWCAIVAPPTVFFCASRIEAGQPCHYNSDVNPCVEGTFCDIMNGDVCKPQASAGAKCANPGRFGCVAGYTCRRDVLGTDAVCTREVKTGGSCLNDWDCIAGDYCKADKCTVQGKLGDACDGLASCQYGTYCTGGTCRDPSSS